MPHGCEANSGGEDDQAGFLPPIELLPSTGKLQFSLLHGRIVHDKGNSKTQTEREFVAKVPDYGVTLTLRAALGSMHVLYDTTATQTAHTLSAMTHLCTFIEIQPEALRVDCANTKVHADESANCSPVCATLTRCSSDRPTNAARCPPRAARIGVGRPSLVCSSSSPNQMRSARSMSGGSTHTLLRLMLSLCAAPINLRSSASSACRSACKDVAFA